PPVFWAEYLQPRPIGLLALVLVRRQVEIDEANPPRLARPTCLIGRDDLRPDRLHLARLVRREKLQPTRASPRLLVPVLLSERSPHRSRLCRGYPQHCPPGKHG